MEENSPIDDVYAHGANIPRNPVDPVYKELEKAWYDIDWAEIDTTDNQWTALADAATYFHYSYLSHVHLLGDIIERALDLRAKRIAIVLANSRMRDVDAWGRYLGKLKTATEIPSELKDHFRVLAADDYVESQVAGIALIDVYRYTIKDRISAIDDPTFRALMERDSEQSRANMRLAESYLTAAVPELDAADWQDMIETIRQYREMTEDIFLAQVASIDSFDREPMDVIAAAKQTADAFFERVGLEE